MTALAAAISIGLAAFGVSLGIGLLANGAFKALGRNPEVGNDIRQNMILAMAFVEATAIYALVISILILFVV